LDTWYDSMDPASERRQAWMARRPARAAQEVPMASRLEAQQELDENRRQLGSAQSRKEEAQKLRDEPKRRRVEGP
jgi:hypothetical protein